MLFTTGKKVLVEPTERQSSNSGSTTKSGLYLPAPIEDEDVNVIQAKIVSVGKDVTTVTEGSLIYFHKFDSKKVVHDGKAYYAMQEESVLAVIE